MDKPFALFGKIVGILLVAAGLVGSGIFLGQKYFQKPTPVPSTPITPTAAATAAPTVSSGSAQQNPQATGRFPVTAGGMKPFVSYLLSGVAGWTVIKAHDSTSDKLILTKGAYEVTILQAALGGGGCTFPGETPADMSITLASPVVQIPLLDGTTLKRGQADSGTNPGKVTYVVCQKGQTNQYGSLTTFGVINYVMPVSPDSATVAEMDAMVGSLQKQ